MAEYHQSLIFDIHKVYSTKTLSLRKFPTITETKNKKITLLGDGYISIFSQLTSRISRLITLAELYFLAPFPISTLLISTTPASLKASHHLSSLSSLHCPFSNLTPSHQNDLQHSLKLYPFLCIRCFTFEYHRQRCALMILTTLLVLFPQFAQLLFINLGILINLSFLYLHCLNQKLIPENNFFNLLITKRPYDFEQNLFRLMRLQNSFGWFDFVCVQSLSFDFEKNF